MDIWIDRRHFSAQIPNGETFKGFLMIAIIIPAFNYNLIEWIGLIRSANFHSEHILFWAGKV